VLPLETVMCYGFLQRVKEYGQDYWLATPKILEGLLVNEEGCKYLLCDLLLTMILGQQLLSYTAAIWAGNGV
jgi:hypothetical protein